jgi:hypothetical protein
MDKEDLNRQFGNPDRQKPITPPDLLAAAHLIRDYCNNNKVCLNCIFRDSTFVCSFFEAVPSEWELSDAEHMTADWIDKQHFQGRGLYTDTDDLVKEG